jgi:hypothetical protein
LPPIERNKAAGKDAGWNKPEVFAKQKLRSLKMAWMPFLGRARDRSGNTASPRKGAEELERIARFPAQAPEMRPSP